MNHTRTHVSKTKKAKHYLISFLNKSDKFQIPNKKIERGGSYIYTDTNETIEQTKKIQSKKSQRNRLKSHKKTKKHDKRRSGG